MPNLWRQIAFAILLPLSMIAGGAAIWFLALQVLVIRRLCLYCSVVHVFGLVIASMMLLDTPLVLGAAQQTLLQSRVSITLAVLSVILFVLGQLLVRPQTYVVKREQRTAQDLSERNESTQQFTASHGHENDAEIKAITAPTKLVTLFNGRVVLKVDEWPILGTRGARFIIAFLFDYTCPTCQRMHRVLAQAARAFQADMGILLISVPQDPTCNPKVRMSSALNPYACRYTRLALAVWTATPQNYPEFERRLLEPEELPPIGLALQYARELTGENDIDPSVTDPQLDGRITQAIAINQSLDTERIPALLMPRALIAGEVTSIQELRKILADELGVIST